MMSRRNSGEERLRDDLEAFAQDVETHLPTADHALSRARLRANAKEEGFMGVLRFPRRNPWGFGAIVVAVTAVALLTVPISYNRTVGYEVRIGIDGPRWDRAEVMKVAQQLKSHLGTEGVSIEREAGEGGERIELVSYVPSGDVRADRVAEAFASQLRAQGVAAEAGVVPRIERVSGTVYAMARERIEISVDGKSAEELEDEIRQAFLDNGIGTVEVSVTEGPDDQREVRIEMEHDVDGGEMGDHEPPEIVLTKDGQPLQGEMEDQTIRLMKRTSDDGEVLEIHVRQNGTDRSAEIPGVDTLSDAELEDAVRQELQSLGLDLEVRVSDGRVEILRR